MNTDEAMEDYSISADPTLIRRMIENLLNNSIMHNEKGCNITVSFEPYKRGKGLLTISDDGQGANQDKIKVLNSRLKSDYLPEHGLGIRVVKQVARKYRYKIKFMSEKGQGFDTKIIVR